MTLILGAGLSGLIAATQFPKAIIYEANGRDTLSHKAVLRFRTDALSRLTGIPFRKVTVRKSIWHNGQHAKPTIQLANWYSRKTNGGYLDRSIWNLEPVERFIAPEDLVDQMASMIGDHRIKWCTPVDGTMLADLPRPIISTLPMPLLNAMIERRTCNWEGFKHARIEVDRFRVHGADVFQTIYYADPDMPAYRASITGDLLIIERRGDMLTSQLEQIAHSFGVELSDLSLIEAGHAQRFGKIAPIDEHQRRRTIFSHTHNHGVYSLGRFAVWRNILLDDVVNDVAVIKRLITQGTYGAALQHSKA